MSGEPRPREWKTTRKAGVYCALGVAATVLKYWAAPQLVAASDPSLAVACALQIAVALFVGLTIDGLRLSPRSRTGSAVIGYVLAVPVMMVGYFIYTPHDLNPRQFLIFAVGVPIIGAAAAAVYWSPPVQ